MLYQDSDYANNNIETAIQWFKKAFTNGGLAEAAFQLGLIYGGDDWDAWRSPVDAKLWFSAANKAGHPGAMRYLQELS